ncbi:MAG: hypothetical protein MK010_10340 [Erythrobacter sp.]|nr:hypothetical protein [Erythrobacter sp.]
MLTLPLALTACSDGEAPAGSYGASEDASQVRTGPRERAVLIGFDGPRFNACAGAGRVTNFGAAEGRTLPVLSAPAGSAEQVDTLASGRRVSMCQKVGDWVGVVYPPETSGDEAPFDCGTGSPVSTRRAYDGPCRSGWVDEDFLELIGG